jgi:predicted small secreted protein
MSIRRLIIGIIIGLCVIMIIAAALSKGAEVERAHMIEQAKADSSVQVGVGFSYVVDGCTIKPAAEYVHIHPVISWQGNSRYIQHYLLINDGNREWLEKSPCENPVIILK